MIKIVKRRTVPLQLSSLQALTWRLRRPHPKESLILQDIAKYEAGYAGERSLNYYLSFLPKKMNSLIHHDLRLKAQYFFQLDTLIITPNYLLLLEVKNYAGYIHQNSHGQLTRTFENKQDLFANPLEQVWRQKVQLEQVLSRLHFPPIPILSYVVFSSPTTELDLSDAPQDAIDKILLAESLPSHVERLNEQYTRPFFQKNETNRLSKTLLALHQPRVKSPLPSYNIKSSEINTGTRCPKCNHLTLLRQHQRHYWVCQNCNHQGKKLYEESLRDYALLFDAKINSKEAKDFLSVDSMGAIYRLLRNSCGKATRRHYDLFPLIERLD